MKQVKGLEIIQLFEQFSPKHLAMEGDKIGLHIGTLNKMVDKVLIALDVTEEVADEAIAKGVQLIIAHHPLIFRPLKTISTEFPGGKTIEKLLKNDISVYVAHTNLDIAEGGVNDLLCQALKLEKTEILITTHQEQLKKLVVFSPLDAEEAIRKAVGEAGAGFIGNYSHCSFSARGVGRFLPGEGTNPYIGETGKTEAVEEVRMETVFPESIEKKVLEAMLAAHPYEEPAYDIYTLAIKGKAHGLGRIGYLPKEMSLGHFANFVKEALDVSGVRVVGDLQKKVRKVAVLGGDGDKYWQEALEKGADVYVTGDMYYHTAIDAKNAGLNIVDPGHNVEKVMKSGIAKIMSDLCNKNGFNVQFISSTIHTDPFHFM